MNESTAEPAVGTVNQELAAALGIEPTERRTSRYRSRFAAIYISLALVAGVAAGAFAVLMTEPETPSAPPWSAWEPNGSNSAKAKEIAEHVSQSYRLESGNQLTAALVGPLQAGFVSGTSVTTVPVRAIVIEPDSSLGLPTDDDLVIVNADTSLMYALCGRGAGCSIGEGKASAERQALLRRESLELALYTFKYIDTVDAVTVFLPPNPENPNPVPLSVFLRKTDVERELGRPLTQSLAPRPPLAGEMTAAELAVVNRVTGSRFYQSEYQQTPDGSAVMVLKPPPSA